MIKQKGGMLAKGRLLGIQFETLLENNLYFTIAAQADRLAMKLRRAMEKKGYSFLVDSWTNQQFPILPCEKLEELSEKFGFSFWGRIDETHAAVRICTSWATTKEQIDALIACL
jgi:threonine aldolase